MIPCERPYCAPMKRELELDGAMKTHLDSKQAIWMPNLVNGQRDWRSKTRMRTHSQAVRLKAETLTLIDNPGTSCLARMKRSKSDLAFIWRLAHYSSTYGWGPSPRA